MNLSKARGRGIALIAVTAVSSLALAACGGSSSSTESSAAASAAAPASSAAAPASSAAPAASDAAAASLPEGAVAAVAALVPEEFKNTPIQNGFYNDYPPQEFMEGDKLVGIQADLVAEMAKVMGVQIENISVGGFDTLIPGIVSGRYDMSSADFGVTQDRLKEVDFVTQFAIGTAFAVKEGSDITIDTATDLCGRSVGVQAGSYFIDQLKEADEECSSAGLEPIDVKTFPNDSARTQAAVNGRIEVTATAQDALGYTIASQNVPLVLQKFVYAPVEQGIIYPDGSGLGAASQAALQEMVSNGTYAAVLEKWGVSSVGYTSPDQVLYLTDPSQDPAAQ